MTSDTLSGVTCALFNAPSITTVPSFAAGRVDSDPFILPIGVLHAPTMNTLFCEVDMAVDSGGRLVAYFIDTYKYRHSL